MKKSKYVMTNRYGEVIAESNNLTALGAETGHSRNTMSSLIDQGGDLGDGRYIWSRGEYEKALEKYGEGALASCTPEELREHRKGDLMRLGVQGMLDRANAMLQRRYGTDPKNSSYISVKKELAVYWEQRRKMMKGGR